MIQYKVILFYMYVINVCFRPKRKKTLDDSGSDSDGKIKKKTKRILKGSGSEASDDEEKKQSGFIIII